VRLLGVGVSKLTDVAARQLSLLEAEPRDAAGSRDPNGRPSDAEWQQATSAVDQIRARFGDDAVGPAALVGTRGLRLKRRGDTQWGPSEPPKRA